MRHALEVGVGDVDVVEKMAYFNSIRITNHHAVRIMSKAVLTT